MSSSALYTPPTPTPPSSPVVPSPSAQPSGLLATFRDALREISPVWLRGKVAGGILYALGAQIDAMGDALTAAVQSRFPGRVSYESLALIGRERRIQRGRGEDDPTYASRLSRWLDDHRRRGGPYALLAQLHAHYAAAAFKIDLFYASGRRFQLATDGTVARDTLGHFTPDEWARWTLLYYWPTPVYPDTIWNDGGIWDDGGVWDSSLAVEEVTDLRLIPREWNAAHCYGRVILLQAGTELWDYPAGTWDEPGGVWLGASIVNVQLAIG